MVTEILISTGGIHDKLHDKLLTYLSSIWFYRSIAVGEINLVLISIQIQFNFAVYYSIQYFFSRLLLYFIPTSTLYVLFFLREEGFALILV